MMNVSLADLLLEFDVLVNAVDREAELQKPHFKELRDELAGITRQLRSLADEQNHLKSHAQAVTQRMRITKGKGQDIAVKLKAAIRSHFGHRYEGLSRFHMRPIRPRSHRVSEEVGIAQLHRPEGQNGSAPAPAGSPPSLPDGTHGD